MVGFGAKSYAHSIQSVLLRWGRTRAEALNVMATPAEILKAKILIVDDLEANITLLEEMLLQAGYRSISSTTDPFRVCDLHLKNKYDLILLDLQMPNMNGLQVIEALKEVENDGYLPVLVITANPGFKLSALKAGARDFVSKPLNLGEVLLRIHNLLEVRLLHLESKRRNSQLTAEGDRHLERISEGRQIEDALQRTQAKMSLHVVKLEALVSERTTELREATKKLEDSVDKTGKKKDDHRTLFL